jgi:hypothetical protein
MLCIRPGRGEIGLNFPIGNSLLPTEPQGRRHGRRKRKGKRNRGEADEGFTESRGYECITDVDTSPKKESGTEAKPVQIDGIMNMRGYEPGMHPRGTCIFICSSARRALR